MGRVIVGLLVTALAMPILAINSGGLAIAAVTIPATFLLGLPAFLALRRWRHLQWWYFAAIGAIAGLLCATPFAILTDGFNPRFFAAFLAYGVVHALLFWFCAVWRNSLVRIEP